MGLGTELSMFNHELSILDLFEQLMSPSIRTISGAAEMETEQVKQLDILPRLLIDTVQGNDFFHYI
jgi:hypothetical protein